jgi:hypothetical protein
MSGLMHAERDFDLVFSRFRAHEKASLFIAKLSIEVTGAWFKQFGIDRGMVDRGL